MSADLDQTLLGIDSCDGLIGLQFDDKCIEKERDFHFPDHVFVFGGKFHPGQVLFEAVKAETVVDALPQDASQGIVPFQDQDVLHPVSARADGGSHTGGASADDNKLYFFHVFFLMYQKEIEFPWIQNGFKSLMYQKEIEFHMDLKRESNPSWIRKKSNSSWNQAVRVPGRLCRKGWSIGRRTV